MRNYQQELIKQKEWMDGYPTRRLVFEYSLKKEQRRFIKKYLFLLHEWKASNTKREYRKSLISMLERVIKNDAYTASEREFMRHQEFKDEYLRLAKLLKTNFKEKWEDYQLK